MLLDTDRWLYRQWYGVVCKDQGMVWLVALSMVWYDMIWWYAKAKHGMVGGTAGAAWHWQVGVRARQRTTVHFPRALLSHASLDRDHLQIISHNCCNISQAGKRLLITQGTAEGSRCSRSRESGTWLCVQGTTMYKVSWNRPPLLRISDPEQTLDMYLDWI